jgi:hypothetical protein
MRKPPGIALGMTIALAVAAGAEAKTLDWTGTTRLSLAHSLNSAPFFTGTGFATVNVATGNDLTRFRPIGVLGGTHTSLLTDPANTSLVSQIASGHLSTERTFTPFTMISKTGGQTKPAINGNRTLPIPGRSKVCILFPGCSNYIPVPFTENGTVGHGVGGMVTVNTFAKGENALKVSVVGRPWTIGVTTVTDVETRNHALSATERTTGFIHGPASATTTASTAAQTGGVIQLVTPSEVRTSLDPPDDRQALLVFGRFRFVPEPGMVLLLGSGVGGLLLVGRRRMRR